MRAAKARVHAWYTGRQPGARLAERHVLGDRGDVGQIIGG